MCTRFLPKKVTKKFATTIAPPDFSKKVPIISPTTIMIPMEPSVSPKPFCKVFRISLVDIPDASPKPMLTKIRTKKGCQLSRLVKKMTNTMAIKRVRKERIIC